MLHCHVAIKVDISYAKCFNVLKYFRSGCLQIRDRVMSINGHENLTMDVANEILQRRNDSHNPKYLTLNVEFSMPNTIEASSGVFNVKLAKTSAGLGVTITGN